MKFDVSSLDVYSHSEYLNAVSESGVEKEDVFGSDTEVKSEFGIKDEVEPLVKVLIKTLFMLLLFAMHSLGIGIN